MSRLRYSTTERDAIARVIKAFQVEQMPEGSADLADLLEALAQSRRSDRHETRRDSQELRPVLNLVARILRDSDPALDKLPIAAKALKALPLPEPEIADFWAPKRRERYASEGTSAREAAFAAYPEEKPSLREEFRVMQLWLDCKGNPDAWHEVKSWDKLIFNRIQTNGIITPAIKRCLAAEEPTDNDYRIIAEYVAEGPDAAVNW